MINTYYECDICGAKVEAATSDIIPILKHCSKSMTALSIILTNEDLDE